MKDEKQIRALFDRLCQKRANCVIMGSKGQRIASAIRLLYWVLNDTEEIPEQLSDIIGRDFDRKKQKDQRKPKVTCLNDLVLGVKK